MQRYFIELIGTFFLTLSIVLTGNPLSMGLMLMAMVYIGGNISGAHFNPAVSVAMWLKNRINMNDLFLYIASQIAGSFIAILIFYTITNVPFAPEVVPGMALGLSIGMEFLLTLVLCWVIATISNNMKYTSSGVDGMIIGFTFMSLTFIGGLFNPAIGMSAWLSNVITGGNFIGINNILIFIIAPLIAGIITPSIEKFCRS